MGQSPLDMHMYDWHLTQMMVKMLSEIAHLVYWTKTIINVGVSRGMDHDPGPNFLWSNFYYNLKHKIKHLKKYLIYLLILAKINYVLLAPNYVKLIYKILYVYKIIH